jgi:hypothetical protein
VVAKRDASTPPDNENSHFQILSEPVTTPGQPFGKFTEGLERIPGRAANETSPMTMRPQMAPEFCVDGISRMSSRRLHVAWRTGSSTQTLGAMKGSHSQVRPAGANLQCRSLTRE